MTRRRSASHGNTRTAWSDELRKLLAQPVGFKAFHIAEPSIIAGAGQPAPDPRLGIRLYGPWHGKDEPGRQQIRVGVIGTAETIDAATAWLDRCRREIHPQKERDADPFLFPSFPGLEAEDGFRCRLDFPQTLTESVTAVEIARCTKADTRDHSVEAMATILGQRLQALAERESPPDVVLVALPQEVREAAGGGRRRKARRRSKAESTQLVLAFMDPKPVEPFAPSRTLHRALKAEGMRTNLPTQLIWPGSLEGSSDVEDDATRAWNFCTALYYKAGGIPWKVSGLGKNTCYVGLSFFQPCDAIGELQVSMAQAFSDKGEGMVLRGTPFHWDESQGPPRLSRDGARTLLSEVILQYERHHQQKPARIVVYKSSSFSEDEIAGMEDSLSGLVSYFDFLSVRPSNVRFLRTGNEPPLRGTAIQITPTRFVVYTRGYVPYLRVYPGLRIPHPIEIEHPRGSGPARGLIGELLSLTRMNWNSAHFANAEPITLDFARKVGLILSELPKEIEARTSFRFYM